MLCPLVNVLRHRSGTYSAGQLPKLVQERLLDCRPPESSILCSSSWSSEDTQKESPCGQQPGEGAALRHSKSASQLGDSGKLGLSFAYLNVVEWSTAAAGTDVQPCKRHQPGKATGICSAAKSSKTSPIARGTCTNAREWLGTSSKRLGTRFCFNPILLQGQPGRCGLESCVDLAGQLALV